MRLVPWAVLLALAWSGEATAQAFQCRLPERLEPFRQPQQEGPTRRLPVSGYTLAVSWSPEYCRGDRQSMQCSGRNGRFGFVLHGLWPESRSGPPPQWCNPTLRPYPELIRRNLCMTPVPWMLAHEWAKHGSCIVATPEAYFRISSILWRSLRCRRGQSRLARQARRPPRFAHRLAARIAVVLWARLHARRLPAPQLRPARRSPAEDLARLVSHRRSLKNARSSSPASPSPIPG
jgi:ribonuclease I